MVPLSPYEEDGDAASLTQAEAGAGQIHPEFGADPGFTDTIDPSGSAGSRFRARRPCRGPGGGRNLSSKRTVQRGLPSPRRPCPTRVGTSRRMNSPARACGSRAASSSVTRTFVVRRVKIGEPIHGLPARHSAPDAPSRFQAMGGRRGREGVWKPKTFSSTMPSPRSRRSIGFMWRMIPFRSSGSSLIGCLPPAASGPPVRRRARPRGADMLELFRGPEILRLVHQGAGIRFDHRKQRAEVAGNAVGDAAGTLRYHGLLQLRVAPATRGLVGDEHEPRGGISIREINRRDLDLDWRPLLCAMPPRHRAVQRPSRACRRPAGTPPRPREAQGRGPVRVISSSSGSRIARRAGFVGRQKPAGTRIEDQHRLGVLLKQEPVARLRLFQGLYGLLPARVRQAALLLPPATPRFPPGRLLQRPAQTLLIPTGLLTF